jgi:hypothetical protein
VSPLPISGRLLLTWWIVSRRVLLSSPWRCDATFYGRNWSRGSTGGASPVACCRVRRWDSNAWVLLQIAYRSVHYTWSSDRDSACCYGTAGQPCRSRFQDRRLLRSGRLPKRDTCLVQDKGHHSLLSQGWRSNGTVLQQPHVHKVTKTSVFPWDHSLLSQDWRSKASTYLATTHVRCYLRSQHAG